MRWGTAKLSTLGIVHDPHASTHAHPPLCLESSEPHTADGTSSDQLTVTEREQEKSISTPTVDLEHASHHTTTPALASAQLVGIAILEFGVILHSFLIGLTLAVTENFKILFIVLVFHRTSPPSSLLSHTLTNSPLTPPKQKHSKASASAPVSPTSTSPPQAAAGPTSPSTPPSSLA